MLAKSWLKALVGALLLVALPTLARTTFAHAVIVRSEPAANARLSESPHEIRLWFTEPLEATYSTIELRDEAGTVISTLPSFVEPTDDHQIVLMVDGLGEGL
jgi:methionine-rich copper-binding protein CopC